MTTTYLDRLQGIETSVAVKAPVLVATTAAITLSGEQTIDGVALVAGDRVLVKDQASAIDNGIWDVSTGTWSRADDFNGARDAVRGTRIFVVAGSTSGNTDWILTTTDPEIGVTSLAFNAVTPAVTSAWTVTGAWTVSGAWTITGNMTFNDNVKAIFGTGSDLQIYHNGSNSFIEDAGTGALSLKGSIVQLMGTSDEVLVRATAGGASELRQNGSTKLTTTTTGVTVTGRVSGDTIGGAMVSTDVSADTGSTTKVPHVSAVEAAIAAASPATLLGTITTTSGATQSLGSLTLTGYKSLRCIVDGVSFSTGAQLTFNSINVSGATAGAAAVIHGIVDLDLGTGVSVGMVGVSGGNSDVYTANTSYGTGTTSITFGASTGNFDAGSIKVYGVK